MKSYYISTTNGTEDGLVCNGNRWWTQVKGRRLGEETWVSEIQGKGLWAEGVRDRWNFRGFLAFGSQDYDRTDMASNKSSIWPWSSCLRTLPVRAVGIVPVYCFFAPRGDDTRPHCDRSRCASRDPGSQLLYTRAITC